MPDNMWPSITASDVRNLSRKIHGKKLRDLVALIMVAVLTFFAGVRYAHTHVHTPAPCPAPALAVGPHWSEPYSGYVASGTRIVGTNGGNGIARGDVFTCVDGLSGVR